MTAATRCGVCGEAVAGSLDGKHRECGWELIVAPKGTKDKLDAIIKQMERLNCYMASQRDWNWQQLYSELNARISPAVVVDVDEVSEETWRGGESLSDAITAVAERQKGKT